MRKLLALSLFIFFFQNHAMSSKTIKTLMQFSENSKTKEELFKGLDNRTLQWIQLQTIKNIILILNDGATMDDTKHPGRPHLIRGILVKNFINEEFEKRQNKL